MGSTLVAKRAWALITLRVLFLGGEIDHSFVDVRQVPDERPLPAGAASSGHWEMAGTMGRRDGTRVSQDARRERRGVHGVQTGCRGVLLAVRRQAEVPRTPVVEEPMRQGQTKWVLDIRVPGLATDDDSIQSYSST